MDEVIINNLLVSTGSIIDKYSAIARETGRSFNIFEIARIEDKEVIICRILAELLDPKGRHGQGGAYLKLFMNGCLELGDMLSDAEVEVMQVTTERMTDKRRPIDLVIEGNGRFIPIEVKIYAADQSSQCSDYHVYARTRDVTAKIVYLTLFGDEPSEDSKGNLAEDDIVLISFDVHILGWLEKCLALPDTIRKTPIREILIQFISAIKKITNKLEDKPKMELVKLLSKSEQHMRNAKAIADTLEDCRHGIVTKFFAAFHDRFCNDLERQPTDWDIDKWDNEISADMTYMYERNVIPGVSVVFMLNASKYDPLLVGFGMIKEGATERFNDKKKVSILRKHYGIDEKKLSEHCITYEYITYDGSRINLIDFSGNHDNYLKLFDPIKFDMIVDSTVEQARLHIAKLKEAYSAGG